VHLNACHPGKLQHFGAVHFGAGEHSVNASAIGILRFSPGKNEARRQTFQVPFPGRTNGLVKIVDIENETAIRRGVCAQVANVSVAADLHKNLRARQRSQVSGHHRNVPAEVTKGRERHARHLDRHQLWNALAIRFRNDGDGIVLAFVGIPTSVIGALQLAAKIAPVLKAFL